MKTKLDHIYGNTGNGAVDAQLQALETRVTNLSNISAKINLAQSFTALQTFGNGARNNGNITNAKDVTTKEYVDNKVGNWTQFENWTGNFKTTDLTWTKVATFANPKKWEFIIRLKWNNTFYEVSFILDVHDVTKDYVTPSFWYNWGQKTSNAIQAVPNSGFYIVYTNKALKIVKFGNNQPEQAELNIQYRGI